jgi:hypothetical protein
MITVKMGRRYDNHGEGYEEYDESDDEENMVMIL